MTAHREQWYRDRLREELERVAAIEDRRERRGAIGRVRVPLKPAMALAAIVAAIVLAIALLGTGADERSAAPPKPQPTPSPAAASPEGVLKRLDGVYSAQITTSIPAGAETLPTGWWWLTIRAADAGFVLSSPSNGGDYTHTITGASPRRLSFAPDGNCEVRAQRDDAATVAFSLEASRLTLRGATGGCRPIWRLLTSTSWYRANG